MSVSQKALDDVALSREEYQLLVQRLGREPTAVELGMIGSLWSEHCGYKHSKPLLRLLPSRGKQVLTKVGEENAGAVEIGDGLCVVMKMESHNHPSAIEPYQGAATGIGGIVRDIFAMGARPIALLDPLGFGPLSHPRNRYLFNGVVGGIAAYGNCMGIPTMGGEIHFSRSYSENPIINVMCVGIARLDSLAGARTGDAGNLLMLVGADTGRDGLHGASGLASRTFDDERELRPTVQVGNPFLEKLLMEACLRLAEAGLIVGLQDLGAAGLTSAAVECAAKGGKGIELDVARVPRREKGMSPYEVMLSESQERMLVVVKGEREEEVRQLFEHWGLHSDIIGHVTDDGLARIREGNKVVAEAPVRLLTDPPLYESRSRKPRWLRHLQNFELGGIRDLPPEESNSVLLTLLSSPNIAAKKLVYQQYDHQVGDNTVIAPGGNAAVLRIKGTQKAISLTADSNGRYCYLDPYRGAAITVAEAGRNLVCTGAEPLAITDCLNFGNPENPDVYYQLRQSVRGMARACRILDIPVISGNVSLYNETGGEAIYPTPVTGMAGLIRDVSKRCTPDFKHSGDLVFLLGSGVKGVEIRALGGSEYLEVMHNMVVGRPSIDLELEKRVQRCCLSAIREGVLGSAHDCSDGGLAVALAESSIMGNIGFRGELDFEGRLDVSFFGECQSRIVVSVSPEKAELLEEIARRKEVLLTRLGRVGGKEFIIGDYIRLPLEQIDEAWRDGLERALRG